MLSHISRASRTLAPLRSAARYSSLPVHRDSAKNNASIPFEFDAKTQALADDVLKKYPAQYKKSAVMPLLDLGQRQHGFCSLSVMNYVAKLLEMPPMRVYEVATFYTMFNRNPMGKYHLQVCTTTPCQLCGSDSIMDAVKEFTNTTPGHTTPDDLFTISEVECLGACVNGPMIAVNDDYYEDLTAESTKALLQALKDGKPTTPGPQENKRRDCEPFGGQNVLKNPEPFHVKDFMQAGL